jgi:hypothetical protein
VLQSIKAQTGFAPPLADTEVLCALQTLRGKEAHKETAEEFEHHMCNIMQSTDALWVIAKANKVIPEGATPIYAFDNPPFHSLSKEALTRLGLKHGEGGNLLEVPRYSGDFMQCVEHAHAYVCKAYQKKRFRRGLPAFDCDVECRELCSAFKDIVTPSGIATDCQNVQKLVAHIVEMGDGGYADLRLT